MTAAASLSRGGATVGVLADLALHEADTIRYLRTWVDGDAHHAVMRKELNRNAPRDLGDRITDAFEDLCAFCVAFGRRPLVCHGRQCDCLGADENCFVNLIAAATEGNTQDARLLASLLVSPQQAPELARLAFQFGELQARAKPRTRAFRAVPVLSALLH